jgi:hemerythrin-like domain-containing protein
LAVHEALGRVERGASTLDDELHEIRDGVEAFREAILEHFAREQEGLLPFALERLPNAQGRIDQLIAEHDRIAAALTQLERELASVDHALPKFRENLARFEELYAAHTRDELAFVREVAETVDPASVARLRTLLDES